MFPIKLFKSGNLSLSHPERLDEVGEWRVAALNRLRPDTATGAARQAREDRAGPAFAGEVSDGVTGHQHALGQEQRTLAIQIAAVAAEFAAGSDHPVAGH